MTSVQDIYYNIENNLYSSENKYIDKIVYLAYYYKTRNQGYVTLTHILHLNCFGYEFEEKYQMMLNQYQDDEDAKIIIENIYKIHVYKPCISGFFLSRRLFDYLKTRDFKILNDFEFISLTQLKDDENKEEVKYNVYKRFRNLTLNTMHFINSENTKFRMNKAIFEEIVKEEEIEKDEIDDEKENKKSRYDNKNSDDELDYSD